jgi:hypothetical protein
VGEGAGLQVQLTFAELEWRGDLWVGRKVGGYVSPWIPLGLIVDMLRWEGRLWEGRRMGEEACPHLIDKGLGRLGDLWVIWWTSAQSQTPLDLLDNMPGWQGHLWGGTGMSEGDWRERRRLSEYVGAVLQFLSPIKRHVPTASRSRMV